MIVKRTPHWRVELTYSSIPHLHAYYPCAFAFSATAAGLSIQIVLESTCKILYVSMFTRKTVLVDENTKIPIPLKVRGNDITSPKKVEMGSLPSDVGHRRKSRQKFGDK